MMDLEKMKINPGKHGIEVFHPMSILGKYNYSNSIKVVLWTTAKTRAVTTEKQSGCVYVSVLQNATNK